MLASQIPRVLGPPRGLLDPVNLIGDFDTVWAASAATRTGGFVGPDGKRSAHKLTEDGTTAEHYIYREPAKAASALKYRFRFCSFGTNRAVLIHIFTASYGASASFIFDHNTGLFLSAPSGALLNSATTRRLPNRWWVHDIYFTHDASTSIPILIYLYNGAGNYAGDGVSNILLALPGLREV